MMSLEDAFDDLLEVAKHRGELDVEAVRKATTVLAWPRYAESADPAALLVQDLKRVIAGIATQPVDDEEPDDADDDVEPQAADKSLHAYARRYFSQEVPGSPFTYRQKLAGDPGGGRKWMSFGVIYRVLAGLLALQIEAAAVTAAISETSAGRGYRIDSVRVLRDVKRSSRLYPIREVAEYELCVLAGGPHLLMLPFPLEYTKLVTVAADRPGGHPQPQLVALNDDGRRAAVVFGAQQDPGERVRIQAEHRPRKSRRSGVLDSVSYPVTQLIGELVLEVQPNTVMKGYRWTVTTQGPMASDHEEIAWPKSRAWSCCNPDVGMTYRLCGYEDGLFEPSAEALARYARQRIDKNE